MSETIEPPVKIEVPPIMVRRAFQPDITEMEPWLMPRLQTIYPDAPRIVLRSALVNGAISNEQWIGRTDNALIAVRSVPENLTGTPFAKVWFALSRRPEEDQEEIAELHWAVTRWMKMADIKQMILSPHTDCHTTYITKRIGGQITKATVRAWNE